MRRRASGIWQLFRWPLFFVFLFVGKEGEIIADCTFLSTEESREASGIRDLESRV